MTDVKTGLGTIVPSDLDYHALVAHVKTTFDTNRERIIFNATPGPGYQAKGDVKAISANSVYLKSLPESEQASHNCFTYRDFFKNYADLVYVAEDGQLVSAVWDPESAPEGYGPTVQALKDRAESGRVTSRFFSKEELYGTAENGNPTKGSFEHFHLAPPLSAGTGVYSVGDKSHESSTWRELFSKSLGDFKPETIDWAIHQFTYDDQLARRPSALHALTAFKDAQALTKTIKNQQHRNNLIWSLSQTLPKGAATLTNTALGTYLERIQSAENDGNRDYARRSYLEQTSPETYQRAATDSSTGQIDAAEKLIEKLGLATALQRRGATLDDIQEWVWQHPEAKEEETAQGGVFDKLRKQVVEKPQSVVAGKRIDWGEFVRDILPQALKVQVQVPEDLHNYGRMVTAVDADAPPILLWDDLEHRNPVSWYIYHGGSVASQWGLKPGDWVELKGVVALPNTWNGKSLPQWGLGHMVVLEGAHEVSNGTLGLFPEILIRDLYAARNAIDNLSRQTELPPVEEGDFAGIIINQGLDVQNGAYLRALVELPTGVVTFDIVRWSK